MRIELLQSGKSEFTLEEKLLFWNCYFKTSTDDLSRAMTREMYDQATFEQMLLNLRLVSKSRMQTAQYCAYKFKLHYIVQYKPTIEKQIMEDGKHLHFVNDQFWKFGISVEDFLNCADDQLAVMMYEKYMKFVPETEISAFILNMINAFIEYETKRILQIYAEVGKSAESIEDFVFPVATELPIENWDNHLMGIIDRIDRLTDGSFCVVEYKYGKPKYFDMQYQRRFIESELAFYQLLITGRKVYVVVEGNQGVPLPEYLELQNETLKFDKGQMIFFQNVAETEFRFNIIPSLIETVQRQIDGYWDMLETGIFKPHVSDACYQCEYYDGICEFLPEFITIDEAFDE